MQCVKDFLLPSMFQAVLTWRLHCQPTPLCSPAHAHPHASPRPHTFATCPARHFELQLRHLELEALEPEPAAHAHSGNGSKRAAAAGTAHASHHAAEGSRAFVQARLHETGRQFAEDAVVGSFDAKSTRQVEGLWVEADRCGSGGGWRRGGIW